MSRRHSLESRRKVLDLLQLRHQTPEAQWPDKPQSDRAHEDVAIRPRAPGQRSVFLVGRRRLSPGRVAVRIAAAAFTNLASAI